MAKIKRDLDGVYFRVKVDGEWTALCFSDLDKKQARALMTENRVNREYLIRMYQLMIEAKVRMFSSAFSQKEMVDVLLDEADSLHKLGDKYDIKATMEDELC